MTHIDKMIKDISKNYEKKLSEKDKEIAILKKENKNKDEVIQDLDKNNYKGKFEQSEKEKAEILKQMEEMKKKLHSYEELLGIAEIKLNKDSSNSCKPSSTDGYKRVIQNNREKTGRKPGREKGHAKSSKDVNPNPDIIKRVSKVATCECGCHTVDVSEIARDVISIEIKAITTQYIGMKTKCPCCNKEYMPRFPETLKSTVNYDDTVKALITYLNGYCNVPTQKVADFLSHLTCGKITISNATVTNTIAQFSKKSEYSLNKIQKHIMKQPTINEDETPITVNGDKMSAIGVFTRNSSLVGAFKNRTIETFEEMGILNKYIGTVCHDHNNIHQSFSNYKDAECNFHILRYCKAEYQIHNRECIKEFMNYLLLLRDEVDRRKSKGLPTFTDEEYREAKIKYLAILSKWDDEYDRSVTNPNSEYHKSERCLKARLREFADDHLRFLKDFTIEFTNNLAERGLRFLKSKLKVMGTFRSLKSAKHYCRVISIIDTCKKQGMDVFESIKKIFRREKLIFNFS